MARAGSEDLQLPFEGRWFVAQAGDTSNVNHHMQVREQAFGVDFVKAGGAAGRDLAAGNASRLEDFFGWGAAVLAPASGIVVRVVSDLPDNSLGTKDPEHPPGNHLVIETGDGRFVFVAHLQQGSAKLDVGDRVRAGQPIGRCGNSGNSDFPHIHLHVQDRLEGGIGQNPIFGPIDVELTGKVFSGVDWPLIRGLFVSPPTQGGD